MKIFNHISIGLLIFSLFFFLNAKTYSQDDIKVCKTYESLYKTIKSGKSASIEKTAWIEEFSLVEKSIITVIPITSPDSVYKVTF
ncbi:MAG: hypothetical protein NTU73_00750 [Ignavibacteriae bacterium]|nr:hypothetical protein [Ignavibacteriota bacterium]